MNRFLYPRMLAALLMALLTNVVGSSVNGQNDSTTPASEKKAAAQSVSPEGETLQKVLERVSRLERELDALRAKEGKVPQDKQDQRIVAVCESPHLGSVPYSAPNNVRYFTTRLLLINLTNEPLVLTREDVQLTVGGQTLTIKDVPQRLQGHSVQLGQQSLILRNLQMPKQIQVNPGATASQWILFSDIPAGNDVPQLVVKLKLGEKTRELDVTAAQRGALGLKVERIGPHASLGLVTLTGQLDTINVGALVEELDRLSTDKVARVVVRWSDSAPPLYDRQLISWLQNTAIQSGRVAGVELPFPPIPVTIRELHLAAIPLDRNSGYSIQQSAGAGVTRIHKTDADAVRAALSSAYESLPRDEVLQAIQTGTPLERAAALENGAGRLAADKLPLILKYADDNDPVIQQAALAALGHFGDQAAIDKLLFYARKNVEPLSSAAVAGLAGSRYAAAHAALLDVLNHESPAGKKNIVKVLARYPRPIWSDAIYEFVQDPREELNREALAALVQVGHPKLVPLLDEVLHGKDATLRQQAFNVLVNRTDRESEEIAVNFTLGELKTAPPTTTMLTLLNRVKDRRALPLLATQFNNSTNKVGIIQTFGILGDEETAKVLVEKYPTLANHEKGEVLRALQRLNSTMFRELAAQALLVSDLQLVGTAVQGLQEDGSPESIKLIIDSLERSGDQNTWSYLCNALATIATPAARAALIKARDSGNDQKRVFASAALQQMRERSPGYAYIFQGMAFQRQEKWKEAIEQYEMAIQLDPQLPDAYAHRADALVRQNKYADAGKDYAKAYELDPYNSNAVTGMCIVMVVVDGKIEEAVKKIEDVRSKFVNQPDFNYNAACVYGRAVELLKKNEKLADREKLIPQYTQAAIADLKKSVELGFQDFDWMKKDPDLNSLHDVPDFEKVATPPNPAEGNGAVPRRALNPRFR